MKTQAHKNLWDVAKAVPRGKFTVIQAFLKKTKQNKKNLKKNQPNLPPETIRRRTTSKT